MTQPCPRFARSILPGPGFVPSWSAEDGRCTFCGSIQPDALFEAIVNDAEIYSANKNNKVFIRFVEFDPDTGLRKAVDEPEEIFQFEHFVVEERERFVQLLNAGDIRFGYPGYLLTQPYFVQKVNGSFEVNADGVPEF